MSYERGAESPNQQQGCVDSGRTNLSLEAFAMPSRHHGNTPIVDNPPVRPDAGISATGGFNTEIRSSESSSPKGSSEPVVINHPNGHPGPEVVRNPKRPTPQATVSGQGEIRDTKRIP